MSDKPDETAAEYLASTRSDNKVQDYLDNMLSGPAVADVINAADGSDSINRRALTSAPGMNQKRAGPALAMVGGRESSGAGHSQHSVEKTNSSVGTGQPAIAKTANGPLTSNGEKPAGSSGQPEEMQVTANLSAASGQRQPVNKPPAPLAGQWQDNGRPGWAQQPFECLLFHVAGLTLALPMVALGTIHPMADELIPVFGRQHYFIGQLPVKGGFLRVLDSAKLVMPERYTSALCDSYGSAIAIKSTDWGFAVDSVSRTILLDPLQAHWRGSSSKRPWLAATVKEHQCTLLDLNQIAQLWAGLDE